MNFYQCAEKHVLNPIMTARKDILEPTLIPDRERQVYRCPVIIRFDEKIGNVHCGAEVYEAQQS